MSALQLIIRDLVILVGESKLLQQLTALTTQLPMKLLVHINVSCLPWVQQICEQLTGRYDGLTSGRDCSILDAMFNLTSPPDHTPHKTPRPL